MNLPDSTEKNETPEAQESGKQESVEAREQRLEELGSQSPEATQEATERKGVNERIKDGADWVNDRWDSLKPETKATLKIAGGAAMLFGGLGGALVASSAYAGLIGAAGGISESTYMAYGGAALLSEISGAAILNSGAKDL